MTGSRHSPHPTQASGVPDDHGSHTHGDDAEGRGHGKHAGHHTEMFRVRFWWSLVLTVPIAISSEMSSSKSEG